MGATKDIVAPLISVVMPVYNVRDYLTESVESVLGQSYPRFQLICVDDGATDGSGKLADELAAADERIVVIHQPNGGASSARNAGIDRATGDVVAFLDADDTLRDGALETIAAAFTATNFDVLTFGGVPWPPEQASVWVREVLSPRRAQFGAFEPRILFKEKTHPFVWRMACKRAFLKEHGLHFDETVIFGEDQLFPFQVYPLSHNTVLIPDKLVTYRVCRKGSLMDIRFSDLERRAQEHVSKLERILETWSDVGWLRQWPRELFEWGVDFVLPSLVLIKDTTGFAPVVENLRRAWMRYFGEAFLQTMAADRMLGPLVTFVMNSSALPSTVRMLLIAFDLRRRAYGLLYALRQAGGSLVDRIRPRRCSLVQ